MSDKPDPGSGPVSQHDTIKDGDNPFQSTAETIRPAGAGAPDTPAGAGSGGDRPGPPGTRFGEYELIEEIARGAMGVVYKARQVKLNRIVALKMILRGNLASAIEVQRFQQEARAAATLDHPGIVPIYEVGEVGGPHGEHYFTMAYIDGKSLAARVADGPLQAREAANLLKSVADAVHYAHTRGIIHRDLKPANILLNQQGLPRVTDFGLAKRVDVSSSGLTATGEILGTPSFMPPEQITRSSGIIGPTCDIYSLGAILYNLLTGRPPFMGETVATTLLQVMDADPLPPRVWNAKVPRELEAICLRCLDKSPQNRYQTAAALAQDLSAFLNGEPVQADIGRTTRLFQVLLRETRHTEVMALWGKVWLWHAALVLLAGVGCNVLMWLRAPMWPYLPVVVPATLGAAIVPWYFRFRRDIPVTPLERQVGLIWAMYFAVWLLTDAVIPLMGISFVRSLTFTLLECSLAFGATAVIMGGSFYPMTAACVVLAFAVALVPDYAPLIFGVVFSIGLLVPGVKYTRKQREAARITAASQARTMAPPQSEGRPS